MEFVPTLRVNELIIRTLSHLVVELRALVVVQDGCVGAAGEERVSRLAVEALKGKQAYQSFECGPFDVGARRRVSAQRSVITECVSVQALHREHL